MLVVLLLPLLSVVVAVIVYTPLLVTVPEVPAVPLTVILFVGEPSMIVGVANKGGGIKWSAINGTLSTTSITEVYILSVTSGAIGQLRLQAIGRWK